MKSTTVSCFTSRACATKGVGTYFNMIVKFAITGRIYRDKGISIEFGRSVYVKPNIFRELDNMRYWMNLFL